MKQVPSIELFHQRQMLQRTGRILPREQEIRPGAVMHGPYIDPRVSLAVEITSLVGHQRERLDVAPDAIGCVAVEQGCVRVADAVDLQAIGRQPIARDHDRGATDRDGRGNDERIGLQGRAARLWRRTPCRCRGCRVRYALRRDRPAPSGIQGWLQIGLRRQFFPMPGFWRQPRRLFGKQRQQLDGIELRRRRLELGGPEDAQQLRRAT